MDNNISYKGRGLYEGAFCQVMDNLDATCYRIADRSYIIEDTIIVQRGETKPYTYPQDVDNMLSIYGYVEILVENLNILSITRIQPLPKFVFCLQKCNITIKYLDINRKQKIERRKRALVFDVISGWWIIPLHYLARIY